MFVGVARSPTGSLAVSGADHLLQFLDVLAREGHELAFAVGVDAIRLNASRAYMVIERTRGNTDQLGGGGDGQFVAVG